MPNKKKNRFVEFLEEFWFPVFLLTSIGIIAVDLFFATRPIPTTNIPSLCSDDVNGTTTCVLEISDYANLQNEIGDLTARVTAIDGGKENRYSCDEQFLTLPLTVEDFLRYDADPPKVVVRTLGLETPASLGYQNCQVIPQSLWPVSKEPINDR